MPFLSEKPDISFKSPLFAGILANTLLSTVPDGPGIGVTVVPERLQRFTIDSERLR